jgi:hypothetical protein
MGCQNLTLVKPGDKDVHYDYVSNELKYDPDLHIPEIRVHTIAQFRTASS